MPPHGLLDDPIASLWKARADVTQSSVQNSAKECRNENVAVREAASLLHAIDKVGGRLLIQRIKRQNPGFGVGAGADGIDADDGVFFRAKSTNAGLIDSDGSREDRVSDIHAASVGAGTIREMVATLAATSGIAVIRQDRIDQTSGVLAGNASCSQRSTEVGQGGCVADGRIRGLICDLPGGHSSNGGYG